MNPFASILFCEKCGAVLKEMSLESLSILRRGIAVRREAATAGQ